ncbi:creatininase family protein [Halococcus saccharolyticus]|uniref:Creatininase n=1 Tax=Halococcus saccharolyticus DSM 5350 TaxID=1227455 RepID=M0MJC3_9EURY|nr:creatininase family protein [Halococcus saccharolyticus]EMA44834.1 creatininase [Halococcus saccharolyticus DSM 5350]
MSDTIGSHPASWAGKPYREIEELATSDGSVLVVPVGSIEQHGHHLPVATDTILADAVAKAGAEHADDSVPVLLTPPVWAGYSPHHRSFGGTITREHGSLRETLEEIADAALDNGFDALLLLNGHGGNASLIDSAVSTIGVDQPDSEVLGLTYFELAEPFIDEIRESEIGGMAHAGEFETSLMLHLRPELVHDDREGTYQEEPYDRSQQDLFVGGPLSVYRPFEDYSPSGAIGDPTLATAEKGARIHDRLGDAMGDLLERIHEENR